MGERAKIQLFRLSVLHYHAIEIEIHQLMIFFQDSRNSTKYLWKFLSWFQDPQDWIDECTTEYRMHRQPRIYKVYILHRPYMLGSSRIENGYRYKIIPSPRFGRWTPNFQSVFHPEGKDFLDDICAYLLSKNTEGSSSTASSSQDQAKSSHKQHSSSIPDDSQFSQDPFSQKEFEEQINWDGYGLFWDSPFSEEYY